MLRYILILSALLMSCKVNAANTTINIAPKTSFLGVKMTTTTTSPSQAPVLVPIDPKLLIIMSGSLTITASSPVHFLIKDSMRASYGTYPYNIVQVDFVYQGPTAVDVPLASGEIRRQIGLKLRAADTCNLVYVMWHFAPTQGIFVSVKSNPGETTHQQCLDNGYINVLPTWHQNVPVVNIGEHHTLQASINGTELQVVADGVLSWKGTLPPAAFAFNGPVGLRSDNADLYVEFLAP